MRMGFNRLLSKNKSLQSTMLAKMRGFSAYRCSHTMMYAALRSSKINTFYFSLAAVKIGSKLELRDISKKFYRPFTEYIGGKA